MQEQISDKPKRIPYGMQNWEDVRLRNCYYVDKTRFIHEIEAANDFFFFIRPRRFGKSLLISMLQNYYDINKAASFDRLFGDLWIGQHPTPDRNTYLVLCLNFSMFSGSLEGYEDRLNEYCLEMMMDFCHRYAALLPEDTLDELRQKKTAQSMLNHINIAAQRTNQKIYLFIDEYDHFTNTILSDPSSETKYKLETHGTGAFRTFFNAVKGTTVTAIKRLFITGVSPVTMDDLTSGFNIGTNYTKSPKFNAMVGFTETEGRQMLDYYRQHYTFRHTTDELIEAMRPWYDNYCFSEDCLSEPPMFNSDMMLYFVSNYIDNNCRFPDQMLDTNIRTDYNKLRMLIRKDRGFEHNASIIEYIVETGGITAQLKDHFPSESITDPDNFVSLLYYFGMLTIAGRRRGKTEFRIPNQTVREQIYGYLTATYKENDLVADDYYRRQLMENMAFDGDWQPYFDFIADTLRRFSSNRDKAKGEAYVHGFTLAQTCLTSLYLPVSELDAGAKTFIGDTTVGGYADIYLQPMLAIYPDIEHSYVLELKYLPSSATDTEVGQARKTAIGQITRYADSLNVERTSGHTKVHKLILLWRGIDLAVAEEL